MIANQILLTMLPLGLTIGALLLALLLQGRRYRTLRHQLALLKLVPTQQPPRPAQAAAPPSFASELQQVETDRATNGTLLSQRPSCELPERYRYVGALARQGLSAEQIASALQIGEGEAAQILRLSRLGGAPSN